jgi:uncharacterized protein YbaR (Trm112 family)
MGRMAFRQYDNLMDPALLQLLCCPLTHQPLRLLTAEEAGQRGLGAQELLLREDGRVYYTFEDHGFPLLLPDSGVAVPGGADGAGRAAGAGADAERS